jgi:DNA-directed RNA polymerase subunit RPC12/RpoP
LNDVLNVGTVSRFAVCANCTRRLIDHTLAMTERRCPGGSGKTFVLQPSLYDAGVIKPRPTTKCQHENCHRRFDEHTEAPDHACPNGSGRRFRLHGRRRGAASNSFTAAEIDALATLVENAPRCELPTLTRSKAFASLARKVLAMVARSNASRSTP